MHFYDYHKLLVILCSFDFFYIPTNPSPSPAPFFFLNLSNLLVYVSTSISPSICLSILFSLLFDLSIFSLTFILLFSLYVLRYHHWANLVGPSKHGRWPTSSTISKQPPLNPIINTSNTNPKINWSWLNIEVEMSYFWINWSVFGWIKDRLYIW